VIFLVDDVRHFFGGFLTAIFKPDFKNLPQSRRKISDMIMKSYLYPPFEMGAEAKP
jgi:hypothetical protein